MGLDLMMYNKREYMKYHDNDYNKITELAYGRKTWAIESYFATRSYPIIQKEYVFNVPEIAWDEFYTTAINLGFEKFKIWVDVISEYEHICENTDDEDNDQFEEIYTKAYNKAEEYLERLLNGATNYQLGMAWEARAVVSWIEAYPEVKKTYERGDGVVMVASF